MTRSPSAACALAIALLGAAGCTFDTNPMMTGYGKATLSWALDGRADPEVCAERGAERVEIVVYDNQGKVVTTEERDCAGFTWESRMAMNVYTAKVRLVDIAGETVGAPRGIVFVVGPGQNTRMAVDLVTGAIGF